jgi:hypothetical protein
VHELPVAQFKSGAAFFKRDLRYDTYTPSHSGAGIIRVFAIKDLSPKAVARIAS